MPSLSELEKYAARHYCPDCPETERLVVKHDRAAKLDYVGCNRCGRREGFTRVKTLSEIFREHPEALPLTVRNTMERKYGAARNKNKSQTTERAS